MGAKQSEEMRNAQEMIIFGYGVYESAEKCGVHASSIYQSKFWIDRHDESWWKKHPANIEQSK